MQHMFQFDAMSLNSLFVTEIWHRTLTARRRWIRLNRDLARDTQILRRLDRDGQRWSNQHYPGGYTSYASVTQTHQRYAPFMELKALIDPHVRAYARQLEWDLQGGSLEMTTCWVNVMSHQVHHSLHLHPLAVLSGTYYVATPQGSGQLRFEDPRLGLFMGSPPRKSNAKAKHQSFVSLAPQAGDLVLWESWLRHEVTPHRGQRERISVSFNYEWR